MVAGGLGRSDWSGGLVSSATLRLLVAGAGSGVGVSVTACAIADVLAVNGVVTALMVVAPPYAAGDVAASSGLNAASLLPTANPHAGLRVGVRASGCRVVGLGSSDPTRHCRPGFFPRSEIPPVKSWTAAAGADVQVEVVDLGWDLLDGVGTADPLQEWVCDPGVAVYPVLVAPASRPGMSRLGDLVTGIDSCRGSIAPVAGTDCGVAESLIVITRARHDTKAGLVTLLPSASDAVQELAARRRLVMLPEDPAVMVSGVAAVFSSELLNAATDVLYGCGAIQPGGSR